MRVLSQSRQKRGRLISDWLERRGPQKRGADTCSGRPGPVTCTALHRVLKTALVPVTGLPHS